jgi:ABC-2 type transport system ATP-binding protein
MSMLEVRDVTKRFGGVTAVSHVSFTLRPGEVLGYLGPNGSGKSTTVKMITGLLAPTSGIILFGGKDVSDDLMGYKAQVGYVPEEAHIYTYLTAPEYLRLVGRLRGIPEARLERKIDAFLQLFGLGADTYAPLASFSKGMRQKVLISAALLHDPRIIVLDEPTSGLDVANALMLRTVVSTLAAEKRLVFYSSHELETTEKISTRVIILRAGVVVADDSAAQLREHLHLASLEDVFAELAIREDVDAMANALVDAMAI